MFSKRQYGGDWTVQLQRVLLEPEWALQQGWWQLSEGLDLEHWNKTAFGDSGAVSA